MLMAAIIRRFIPTALLAFLAFYMAADTLILQTTLNSYATSWRQAQAIIAAFAVSLSVFLLSRTHIRRIQRRRNVIESSVLLVVMLGTLVYGLIRMASGVSPIVEVNIARVFNAVVVPGDATIYAILAFFIASAAYRAFRARTVESVILLVTGCIVMLGKAPIGESIWFGFVPLSNFTLFVLNKAYSRVIVMSSLLATTALYIRIILGYERGWMGRGD